MSVDKLALLAETPALPYAVWALIALAGGVSTLWLPELRGEPSLETLDDLAKLIVRRQGVRDV